MKLEIYVYTQSIPKFRGELKFQHHYTMYINGRIVARLSTDIKDYCLTKPDEDSHFIQELFKYVEHNTDKVIDSLTSKYSSMLIGDCIYSSSDDKLLKDLYIEIKKQEMQEDFDD